MEANANRQNTKGEARSNHRKRWNWRVVPDSVQLYKNKFVNVWNRQCSRKTQFTPEKIKLDRINRKSFKKATFKTVPSSDDFQRDYAKLLKSR